MSMEKRIYLLSQSIEKRFVLSVDEEIILFDVKSKEGTTKYFINKEQQRPQQQEQEQERQEQEQ